MSSPEEEKDVTNYGKTNHYKFCDYVIINNMTWIRKFFYELLGKGLTIYCNIVWNSLYIDMSQ